MTRYILSDVSNPNNLGKFYGWPDFFDGEDIALPIPLLEPVSITTLLVRLLLLSAQ
jgi:hypothetical protein